MSNTIYSLAWCYMSGKGREKNIAEAKLWFQNGASVGHPPSEFWLALMERNRSPEKSLKLMHSASEKGYPDAQYELGLSYINGEYGAPKKPIQGLMWLIISENNVNEGFKSSIKKQKSLFQRMNY